MKLKTLLKKGAYEATCEAFKYIIDTSKFDEIYTELDDEAHIAFSLNKIRESITDIRHNPDFVKVSRVFNINESSELKKLGEKAIILAISEYLYCEVQVKNFTVKVTHKRIGPVWQYVIRLDFILSM